MLTGGAAVFEGLLGPAWGILKGPKRPPYLGAHQVLEPRSHVGEVRGFRRVHQDSARASVFHSMWVYRRKSQRHED